MEEPHTASTSLKTLSVVAKGRRNSATKSKIKTHNSFLMNCIIYLKIRLESSLIKKDLITERPLTISRTKQKKTQKTTGTVSRKKI
jgi:hypothetical protein